MDWLKLTEADIQEIQRQAASSMPAVIRIEPEDITSAAPPPAAPPLKIGPEDLSPAAAQHQPLPEMDVLERLIFTLVNNARRDALPGWLGSAELKWHAGAAAVARGHSLDMLRRHYVDHRSPEGVTAAKRIENQGIPFVACGENIGAVTGDAARSEQGVHQIHRAFMNQPRSLSNHRGNILNPIWTHLGVGIARHESGTMIVTENFLCWPKSS